MRVHVLPLLLLDARICVERQLMAAGTNDQFAEESWPGIRTDTDILAPLMSLDRSLASIGKFVGSTGVDVNGFISLVCVLLADDDDVDDGVCFGVLRIPPFSGRGLESGGVGSIMLS